MTQLDGRKRKQLRDRDFAYVDSAGGRRLPIHDASHVRNALARFGQVAFESEEARDRARTRLLKAARKHGIIPIGFIDGQIRGRSRPPLPTGTVTFLMSDVVDSTGILQRIGNEYAPAIAALRRMQRAATRRAGGHEVDARGDEFFAAFRLAGDALEAAREIQRCVRAEAWPGGEHLRLRIGLHSGRPVLTDAGYVGLAVHAVQRICSMSDGAQIIVSRPTVLRLDQGRRMELRFEDMGEHRLRGLARAERLYRLAAE